MINFIQLDPNGLCNAGCWFCPVSSIGNPKDQIAQMEVELFEKIISEITFLGQFVRYLLVLNNKQEIQVRAYEELVNLNVNDTVSLSWKLEDFLLHQN